jgi:hypothetical protein
MAKKSTDLNDDNTGDVTTETVAQGTGVIAPVVVDATIADAVIDPYHCHGGSYVVDDATQTRKPNA